MIVYCAGEHALLQGAPWADIGPPGDDSPKEQRRKENPRTDEVVPKEEAPCRNGQGAEDERPPAREPGSPPRDEIAQVAAAPIASSRITPTRIGE